MKSKFKNLLCLLIPLSLILSGCTNSNNTSSSSNNSDDTLNIVTSFYPIYISTLNVIKDVPNVELTNMTKAQTGCLHDYELTPQDLKTLDKADVFVINGAGMESFLDKIISQFNSMDIIDSSSNISLIESAEDHDHDSEEHNHDSEEHDHEHEENPHVWVSISKNIQQVQNIADGLSKIDPNNADKYQANATEYIDKLKVLQTKMHEELDSLPNRNIITFHEAFPYFAEEFNLNIVGVIQVEPDSEPSAKEIESVIETIKSNNVKALFTEPQYSSKTAETIAKETGTKVYTLDPIVTGDATKNAYNDYIDKMENNLNILKEALQ